MMILIMTHNDMVILFGDVPGPPYLGEAMSWSCLATVLRFVATLRCTGRVMISLAFRKDNETYSNYHDGDIS